MENPGDIINYDQNDVYYLPESIGEIVGGHYKALINSGVAEEQAGRLTAIFQSQLMSRLRFVGEKPKISKERLINAVLNREA